MQFEHDNSSENIGRKVGFIISYLVFTTMAFFVFTFLNRLPVSWSWFHVAGVTLGITFLGKVLQRFIK